MFENLKPVNDDPRFPKYLIAGVEWLGYVWSGDRALCEATHTRSDGCVVRLGGGAQDGVRLSMKKELAPGVAAEKSETFDSIEKAAEMGLVAEFDTVEAAGEVWFQCRDGDAYSEWVCAFGPHDEGKVIRFQHSGFHCSRTIEVKDRVFKVEHYGNRLGQGDKDAEIKTFEEAAQACASLFDSLLMCRGGDEAKDAFKAGRNALKREISAL